MEPLISMITLGVADLQRAVAFYEDGLNLPRMKSPTEVVFLTLNGTWLGLYDTGDFAKDIDIPADGKGFRAFALAHNVRKEEEMDALIDQAVAAGGKLMKKAQRASWGGYSGYFADPDGHLWEVALNPHFCVGLE